MTDPLSQLHAAIRSMDVEAVDAALLAGASPTHCMPEPLSWSPLHHAAILGSARATELLLAAGADPGAVASVRLARGEPGFAGGEGSGAPEVLFEDATPLHLALAFDNAPVAEALLAAAPHVALRRVGIRLVRMAGAAAGEEQQEQPMQGGNGAVPPPAGAVPAGDANANFTPRATLELSLLRGSLRTTLRLLNATPVPLLRPLVEQVQPPCPELASVLPVVLSRCPHAAQALAARLSAAQRQRLRTAVLCLERLQRVQLQGRRLPPKFVAAALSLALAP